MSYILHYDDLPDDLELNGDLAIDTEAMGLNNHRDRLCMVQISDGSGVAHLVKFHRDYTAKNLKKLLLNEEVTKIFHYARFDLSIMQYYLGIKLSNIFCTKLASRLVRTYTSEHSLKDLCKDLAGVSISKAQQTTDWGADSLSKEQLAYAASDVLYLHRIRENLLVLLEREGRFEVAQECFRSIITLSELDIMGFDDSLFMH